jgi:hypothetical protein
LTAWICSTAIRGEVVRVVITGIRPDVPSDPVQVTAQRMDKVGFTPLLAR